MTAALHADIQAANERFMRAVKARDKEQFARLYTEDAIVSPPGREPLVGRTGVQAFFASFEARGVGEVRLTTLELEVIADTAWERGRSEVRGIDGAIMGTGNYIVVWKRTADGWKLHRDIMNASG